MVRRGVFPENSRQVQPRLLRNIHAGSWGPHSLQKRSDLNRHCSFRGRKPLYRAHNDCSRCWVVLLHLGTSSQGTFLYPQTLLRLQILIC